MNGDDSAVLLSRTATKVLTAWTAENVDLNSPVV